MIDANEILQWVAIAFLGYWAAKLTLAIQSFGKALQAMTEIMMEDEAGKAS